MATLKVMIDRKRNTKDVDINGATSMAYAAAHVAEALGYPVDGQYHFFLVYGDGSGPVPADEIAAEHDGQVVVLYLHKR